MTAELNEDGFQIFSQPDGYRFLYLESHRLSEYLSYYKKHQEFGVAISRFHGYKAEDLNFLKEIPSVKAIYIQDRIEDINGLYHLHDLDYLMLTGTKLEFDISRFRKLCKFRGGWSCKLKNLNKCQTIEKLALWNYNPNKKNLTPISSLNNVKELELNISAIHSLDGIEKLMKLEVIRLNYLSKLEEIEKLEKLKANLTILRFDHCKKIKSFEGISLLTNLKELGINECGSIPSLKFITSLTELKHLSFLDTKILDGDLSPCLIPSKIEHVGFLNQRNYSHTDREINEIISNRQGSM